MTITDHASTGAPSPSGPPAARAIDLVKIYGKGDAAVHALAGVNVEFLRGQFTAVMGPSGSGKSTLMHCMAGLDTATSGQAYVGDQDIGLLDDAGPDPDAPGPRRIRLPVVQPRSHAHRTREHHAPVRSGREEDRPSMVRLPRRAAGHRRPAHRTGPPEMSGGQQQRAACARALIGRPDLIFADEPTGNLDSNSSAEMLGFLRRSVTEFNQSIVMVTHDPRGAAYADRVVFLADGKVVGELASPTADSVLEHMKQLGN